MDDRHPDTPATTTPTIYAFESFVFDVDSQILTREGEEVVLPPRIGSLLGCLLAEAGNLVRKEEILSDAWDKAVVSDGALSYGISQLRQALGDSVREPRFIQTVHRRGYRFIAPVDRLPGRSRDASNGRPDRSVSGARSTGPHAETDGATPAETPAAAAAAARPAAAGRRRSIDRGPIAWAAALVAVAALAIMASPAADDLVDRFDEAYVLSIVPEEGRLDTFDPRFTLSPDGRDLVFTVIAADGQPRLRHRDLGQVASSPLAAAAEGVRPAFTADGSRVAFFEGRRIRVVPLLGGSGETILESSSVLGLSPQADGSVLFTQVPYGGLGRFSPDGTQRTVTAPDRSQGELAHLGPEALPGGRHVLFTIWKGLAEGSAIGVADLETGEHRPLIEHGYHPQLTADGWLLYMRGDDLVAARFDTERLELLSAPLSLGLPVAVDPQLGVAGYEVSDDETLAFVPSSPRAHLRRLVRVSPGGEETVLGLEPREIRSLRPSPDGRRVAFSAGSDRAADLWIADLTTGALSRLTHGEVTAYPVWHPNGREIVYSSNRDGPFNLYLIPVDGSSSPVRLLPAATLQIPGSWSSGGARLCFSQDGAGTGMDLWLLDLRGGEPRAEPLLASPDDEILCEVSPDDRWVAYTSNQTGSYEIFLRSLGASGEPDRQLSSGAGAYPFWRDAGTVGWIDGMGRAMAEPIDVHGLPAAEPQPLFERAGLRRVRPLPGGGLLIDVPAEPSPANDRIDVVVHWRSLLSSSRRGTRTTPAPSARLAALLDRLRWRGSWSRAFVQSASNRPDVTASLDWTRGSKLQPTLHSSATKAHALSASSSKGT